MYQVRSEFSVGDIVEFELRRTSTGKVDCFPRWDLELDHGPSGAWCEGTVTSVDASGNVYIAFLNQDTMRSEFWMFPCDTGYKAREGYLRKKVSRCECGATVVYGENAPHSHWCPAYKPTPSPRP